MKVKDLIIETEYVYINLIEGASIKTEMLPTKKSVEKYGDYTVQEYYPPANEGMLEAAGAHSVVVITESRELRG